MFEVFSLKWAVAPPCESSKLTFCGVEHKLELLTKIKHQYCAEIEGLRTVRRGCLRDRMLSQSLSGLSVQWWMEGSGEAMRGRCPGFC